MDKKLDDLQKICNDLYEEYGPIDKVVNLQAAINGLRHKFDIPDKSEFLFEDFVQ